ALVSTSEGVITDKEARKRNVGGEIISNRFICVCQIEFRMLNSRRI
ncbi:30S ribosomal protein S8, partial [Staphylococcus aureus]